MCHEHYDAKEDFKLFASLLTVLFLVLNMYCILANEKQQRLTYECSYIYKHVHTSGIMYRIVNCVRFRQRRICVKKKNSTHAVWTLFICVSTAAMFELSETCSHLFHRLVLDT